MRVWQGAIAGFVIFAVSGNGSTLADSGSAVLDRGVSTTTLENMGLQLQEAEPGFEAESDDRILSPSQLERRAPLRIFREGVDTNSFGAGTIFN